MSLHSSIYPKNIIVVKFFKKAFRIFDFFVLWFLYEGFLKFFFIAIFYGLKLNVARPLSRVLTCVG